MVGSTPLIEPASFDLVVLGTGLPQCIVAAAAAASGHSVLHLDPCDFYGSHWASLPLSDLSDWIASGGLLPIPRPHPLRPPNLRADAALQHANGPSPAEAELPVDQAPGDAPDRNRISQNGIGALPDHSARQNLADDPRGPSLRAETELADLGLEAVGITFDRPVYSDFKVRRFGEESLGPSRSYNIDLAGPKLAFCGGPMVDLLIRSGASNYLEFKGLEASYIWSSQGLAPVPSSRADVFKDRTLSPLEKRYLMRFFKLVVDYASSPDGAVQSGLTAEDLDGPFLELLRRQQLPSSIQSIILYAIALADDDQEEHLEASSRTIMARDGLQSLALYLTSVGRFPNATGAFLYPLYGQGELSQAFSRCAAVNGALYVLRMPVDALLRDKETRNYKGVRTASGQLLFGQKLVIGPSFKSMHANGSLPEIPATELHDQAAVHFLFESSTSTGHIRRAVKVARSICITDSSLQIGQSTVMVVFPPGSISQGVTRVIRALQLGSNAYVCPEGKYLVHFSTICSEGPEGIEALQAAIRALFFVQDRSSDLNITDQSSSDNGMAGRGDKPTLLWSVHYVQISNCPHGFELEMPPNSIAMCSIPDWTLDYRSVVISAEKVFEDLFAGENFFPRRVDTEGDSGELENNDLMDGADIHADTTENLST